MKTRHDDIIRVWLHIKVAAHLEGMHEYDYRRWLLKRLICGCQPLPLLRTSLRHVTPRHDWWQYRRDDWQYVHESSLTVPARETLLRLRRRALTAEEALEDDLTGRESFYLAIQSGQIDTENMLRVTMLDAALTYHMPGLIGCVPPARALDVRPGAMTRPLHAETARRVHVLHALDDAGLRSYHSMTLETIKVGVAQRADLSKAAADRAVKAFIAELTASLTHGESVNVPGFGTFKVEQRAEKSCINPQTKQRMVVPAKRAPIFRAAPALKEAVNP